MQTSLGIESVFSWVGGGSSASAAGAGYQSDLALTLIGEEELLKKPAFLLLT